MKNGMGDWTVAEIEKQLTTAMGPNQKAELAIPEIAKLYVKGRVLKVDLSGDEFSPALYDRDNGAGAAAGAIAPLRQT